MTYRRDIGSVESALTEAVNAISPDRLEAVTGKTRSAFEKAMNPMHPTQLSLKDAARIDAAVYVDNGFRVLKSAFESETRKQIQSMEHSSVHSVSYDLHLSSIMKEVGDVARAYHDARDPNSANGSNRSKEENEELHQEITEAIKALEAMKKDVEADLHAHPHLKRVAE